MVERYPLIPFRWQTELAKSVPIIGPYKVMKTKFTGEGKITINITLCKLTVSRRCYAFIESYFYCIDVLEEQIK